MEDTLYNQIAETLRGKIRGGELNPGSRLPSEAELSRQFGVSRITSKRALSELEREDLIYRKKGSGSYVRPEKPCEATVGGQIAMVVPIGTPRAGLMDIISGAVDALFENGYGLSVHSSMRDSLAERKLLESLWGGPVCGVICYPVSDNDNLDLISAMSANRFPFVAVDRQYEGLPIASAASDDFDGGRRLTRYLLDLDHRNIAFFATRALGEASSVRQRYFGYAAALGEAGVRYRGVMLRRELGGAEYSNCDEKIKQGFQDVISELLCDGATAVIAQSDHHAVNLIAACDDLGVEVPGRLSVAGFDNLPMSAHITPPLTTVGQDFTGIGRSAAGLVLELLGGSDPRKIILPVELIARGSCVKPRGVKTV